MCCFSPLAHDLAVHLELFMIVALHHQHDVLANHEVRILVLIGVVAHAHGPVWEIAEHAAPARRLLRSRHASILLFPTSEERLYAEPVKQTKAENFTCTLLL